MEKNDQTTVSKYISFRNGFIASTCSKFSTSPLDRLKILIQSQTKTYKNVGLFRKNNGLLQAFKNMQNELGYYGLFRSQSVALLRHGTHGGLGFLIWDNFQEKYNNKSENSYKWYNNFWIGAVAGSGATVISTPLDTIRVLHTTRITSSYKDILKKLTTPVEQSKKLPLLPPFIQNLWAGHLAAQFGVIFYAGLNFGFKKCTTEYLYNTYPDQFFIKNDIKKPTLYCSFGSGMVASILTQFITYPWEILKRRKQYRNVSYLKLYGDIMTGSSKEIWVNLYRGFSINIIRHPLANGIVWMVKEKLDQY